MNGFLSPKEITEKVVEIGKNKSELQILPMLLLGMLAGVYIGFGAELCTMVTHDLSKYLGVGFAKFVGGSVFTVGLMLVVLAGAELFTGNCLMLTGVLAGKVSVNGMLRNWFFVFFANFAGSILLVIIMYYSNLWKVGNLGVGAAALVTAVGKVNLSFSEAFCRGIACNWLVCLAVWLAIAGKDAISKIFGVYFPIMAFVASGFEHSVANMYFIPMGLFLKGNAAVVSAAGLTEAVNNLTWSKFLVENLVPVTLGNIIGGAFFVGGVYYFAYLRKGND
jgi:formate/nitrite transporter